MGTGAGGRLSCARWLPVPGRVGEGCAPAWLPLARSRSAAAYTASFRLVTPDHRPLEHHFCTVWAHPAHSMHVTSCRMHAVSNCLCWHACMCVRCFVRSLPHACSLHAPSAQSRTHKHTCMPTQTVANMSCNARGIPAPAHAQVFVAGSTGNTGRRVVQALRAQGFAVRAGVRVSAGRAGGTPAAAALPRTHAGASGHSAALGAARHGTCSIATNVVQVNP